MSDVNEWIKERRAIHDTATEGPWDNDERGIRATAGFLIAQDVLLDDEDAIVDAHNTLPAALSALEKVLELHYPITVWGNTFCEECFAYTDIDGKYPCDTVRAIEGAISD